MKLASALAAGVAGAFAMDCVQDGFSAIFERNRADDDRDEETEAIVAVVRSIARFVPYGFAKNKPAIAGRVLHYVFGSGFAIAYGAIRERRPGVAAGRGLGFGVALWLLSDVVLIPALHFGRPLSKYSIFEHANAFASHAAYAVTVEAMLRRAEHAS